MKFETALPAKTKVKKSKTGLGLYADEDIKKGSFIIEYKGEKIDHAEADRRGGKYLFEINPRVTIDGKGRENTARYVNHACKPNAEVDIKKERIYISAIKNIKKGEEINYDYGKEYWDEFIKPHGCKCDSCEKKKMTKKK